MISFSHFYQQIAGSPLEPWLETLPVQLACWQRAAQHGQIKRWLRAVTRLPNLSPDHLDLSDHIRAELATPLPEGQRACIEQLLQILMPWRKGPYSLYGIHIDSEWRSDLKWQRLLPHISPLHGRRVLDVGCGNGYHLWHMLGAGAQQVIGIDPTPLFFCQFAAVSTLLGTVKPVYFLPVGIEQLPELNAFDSVFSMGVLYHRRSPLDHLWQLKNQLIAGGELVLETLVIEGGVNDVLLPTDRYARMRNIYFIPSPLALKNWLEKCGFIDVKIVNLCPTTGTEQRRTSWMKSESLADCLHPQDNSKTIEGYPAPLRALLIARKPVHSLTAVA